MELKKIRHKYFDLYANCIAVKGFKRSIIYDLQKSSWEFIPNNLFDLIELCGRKNTFSECYEMDNLFSNSMLDQYFKFLIEKNYLLIVDDKSQFAHFPNLDRTFDFPGILTNAILDFDSDTLNTANYGDYVDLIKEFYSLGCNNYQFRSFGTQTNSILFNLLKETNNLDIEIDLIYPYTNSTTEDLENFFFEITNLRSIVIHSVPPEKILHNETKFDITFTETFLTDNSCCGVIKPQYFSINLPMFTESLQFNNCLNRKIGVDIYGNIKNCPSMEKVYSKVGRTVTDIVQDPEFQKIWKLNKDSILKCNICEFRYMCTDCRAFLDNLNDKPLKCFYDPLTAVWEKNKEI
ncbi:grasp-with-spasm system SPASM domain peptide maturase [Sphingobacterium multivorum]|uniref:grasp-with-spasm system SPASM domain peptide maturase n=1 Tax=Sphingobacterium multivorum TaxID=28454 RepID=UPI0028AECA67|nr:grasp-with-spasm system SPASM domain peptide maturase [Sphingobacterium multivorum]